MLRIRQQESEKQEQTLNSEYLEFQVGSALRLQWCGWLFGQVREKWLNEATRMWGQWLDVDLKSDSKYDL